MLGKSGQVFKTWSWNVKKFWKGVQDCHRYDGKSGQMLESVVQFDERV